MRAERDVRGRRLMPGLSERWPEVTELGSIVANAADTGRKDSITECLFYSVCLSVCVVVYHYYN